MHCVRLQHYNLLRDCANSLFGSAGQSREEKKKRVDSTVNLHLFLNPSSPYFGNFKTSEIVVAFEENLKYKKKFER